MSTTGIQQAIEVLRIHLATLGSSQRGAQTSALVNLIYQDRLNTPPLDQTDPHAALAEACARFADILDDYLLLATLLLNVAAGATGRTTDQILNDIVTGGTPGPGL